MRSLSLSGLALCSLLVVAAPAQERPISVSLEGAIGTITDRFVIADGLGVHLGATRLYALVDRFALSSEGRLVLSSAVLLSADEEAINVDFTLDLDRTTGIAVGTATFNGGTGRFDDATGSADVLLIFAERSLNFELYLEGSIDY